MPSLAEKGAALAGVLGVMHAPFLYPQEAFAQNISDPRNLESIGVEFKDTRTFISIPEIKSELKITPHCTGNESSFTLEWVRRDLDLGEKASLGIAFWNTTAEGREFLEIRVLVLEGILGHPREIYKIDTELLPGRYWFIADPLTNPRAMGNSQFEYALECPPSLESEDTEQEEL